MSAPAPRTSHMDEAFRQRELWIEATLTPPQQENIRVAMARDESLTAHAFLAGYFAALDVVGVSKRDWF